MGGLWWGPTAAAQNKAPIERRRFHPPRLGRGGQGGAPHACLTHVCVHGCGKRGARLHRAGALLAHVCAHAGTDTAVWGCPVPPTPPRSYGPRVPRMAPLLLCLHFYAPPVPHIPNVPSVPMPPMYPMAPPCPSMSPRVPMSPHLHDPILCCPHVPIPPPRGTLRVGVTRGRRGEEGMRGVGTAASLPGRVHAWAHPREPPRPLPRLSPPH